MYIIIIIIIKQLSFLLCSIELLEKYSAKNSYFVIGACREVGALCGGSQMELREGDVLSWGCVVLGLQGAGL